MSSSSASAPSAAAVAQQEAALRKLEAERDRLVAEVLTLQEAMSTSKACEECVAAAASRRAGGEAGASLARLLVCALAHPASFTYDARARSGAHLRANRRLVPPRSPRARRLVKYVESTPEPFAEGGKDGGPNPWTQQVVGGQQCCVVT